jgi:hypothetical protein
MTSATGKLRFGVMPSVGAVLWIVFFVGLNATGWRHVAVSADGDPSLHRRLGNWMMENRQVIRSDVLSHTKTGEPFVTKEWLSQIVFAAAGNLWDWGGVALVSSLLIATCLWMLYRQMRENDTGALMSALVTLATAWACSVHWLARPHLFSHLLVVWFAWQLSRYERGKLSSQGLLWRLAPVMAVWVNVHGAFVYGLVLIGMHLVGGMVARKGFRPLMFVLAVCAAVTLLNPNGWKLLAVVTGFFQPTGLVDMVNEFKSPDFHSAELRGFLVVLGLWGAVLFWVRPRWTVTELLLVGGWGYLALYSVRNVPVFALVSAPVLARFLDDGWKQSWGARVRAAEQVDHGRGGFVWAALACAVVVVGVARGWWSTELRVDRLPVASVRFVKLHPDLLRGEMFNTDVWGSYLTWALPERRVFMDSRHEFFGVDFIREYQSVTRVQTNWSSVLNRYDVGWTLMPSGHALNRVLELSDEWELVNRDSTAEIYARKGRQGNR